MTLRSTARRGARRTAVLVMALLGLSLLAGCAATPGSGDGATVAASSPSAPVPASPGRDGAAGAPPSSTGGTESADPGQGPLTPPAPSSVDPPSGSDGMPAVVERIETDDPVVFLTIDDGWTADPDLPALLRRYGAHVTVFATDDAIAGKTGYLRDVVEAGATVQNHTLSHPDLRTVSSAAAAEQICGASDRYAQRFGTRPWLLRPPYGAYDDDALRAAAGCGIDYVVLWDVSQPGRRPVFAEGSRFRKGDIVLLHFTPHLAEYLERTLKMIEGRGLKVGRLEDYLPARSA